MPSRFNYAHQAVAFAGLDTRQHESGSTRLSKVGHAFVRKALYMPAMVTAYRTDWGKRFAARLCNLFSVNFRVGGHDVRVTG